MALTSRTGERGHGRRPGDAGFTMAELLVAVLILGLLAAIAVPSVSDAIQRAREAALKENLQVMRHALDDYFADTASYPTSLDALVEGRYIRFVPEDPVAPDGAGWDVERQGSGGITDVHSTSDALSLNETRYSDW